MPRHGGSGSGLDWFGMVVFHQEDCKKGLSVVLDEGQVFEIRVLNAKRNGSAVSLTASGTFDNLEKAIRSVSEIAKDVDSASFFYTVNPLNPSAMSRRPNYIDFCDKSDHLASDLDVIERRWILFDLDPVRAAGVPSSDDELEEAKKAGRELFSALKEQLSEPLIFVSGNGIHAMLKTSIPVSDGDCLVKRCLESAANIVSQKTNLVQVDRKVCNLARIWRLPGSMSAKGCEYPPQKRFYRKAELLYAPKSLQAVSRERLEAFAGPAKTEAPRRSETALATPREVFYPEDWLRSHGIAISHTKPWHDATAYVLEQCPFSSSHRSPDSMLLQFADGRIVFYCAHNSCRSKGWFDFREQVEPGWREKRKLTPGYGSEVQSERQRQILRSMMREEWLLFREFSAQKGI